MSEQNKLSQEEQEQLSQDKLLLSLTGQEGWHKVLKPWLEERRAKSYPDPKEFKSENEFLYAATKASVFKKVVAELLHYLEVEVPYRVKQLEAKNEGEIYNFEIGM